MALTQRSRTALFQGLSGVIPDPQAVEELLAHFPSRDLEEPVTKEYLDAQLSGIRVEMAELRGEMRGEMAELRTEMAELRTELRTEMAELRTEMAELRGEVRAELAGVRVDMALLRDELRADRVVAQRQVIAVLVVALVSLLVSMAQLA